MLSEEDIIIFSLLLCCGSGMFIPDPNSFHPVSRIHIKEFKYFKSPVLFIQDPDHDFLPSRILDLGVKKAPDPGSGSATLHYYFCCSG
jgi:hypothetical protein